MNFKNKKKFGFTLMEIVIAVFIVALLTFLTVPIITRQLEKSEEYSYYLAYKTVEQMAGQIVSLGDPAELEAKLIDDTKIVNNTPSIKEKFIKSVDNSKKIFSSLATRFASSEEFMFRKLFPKAFAESYTSTYHSWDSEIYDELWAAYQVCNGRTDIPKTVESVENPDGSITENVVYYTPDDFDKCIGYTKAGSLDDVPVSMHQNFQMELFNEKCDVSNIANAASSMATENPDATAFCNNVVKPRCTGKSDNTEYSIKYESITGSTEDTGNEEDDEPVPEGTQELPESPNPGMCVFESTVELSSDNIGSSVTPSARPAFSDANCGPARGFVNMKNEAAPEAVSCVCKPGTVESSNNVKACYSPCTGAGETLYSKSNNTSICCKTDFNSNENKCCPDKSVFDGSQCTCIQGYDMVEGQCVANGKCLAGSTWNATDKVCVSNPPVLKAKRFCELVAEHWNIAQSSCGTWDTKENIQYNKQVYDAVNIAKADGTSTLMSINAKIGAFANITPNITFANGLRMWILADKAASIPGLSYTTVGASESQNVCRRLDLNTHVKCALQDGYFCKSENNCFIMDEESKNAIGDARACCAATDFSDIAAAALITPGLNKDDYLRSPNVYGISGFTVFVDINGSKGAGTLWDDVYPFFVAANGKVYPGYPLDANKTADTASKSLYIGGNSEKQLAVDVYYYETDANDTLRKYVVYSGVSFARAMCSARKISKYTPYCLNLGEKFDAHDPDGILKGTAYLQRNDTPCDKHNCFVAVRKKLKSF